ncbi:interleukin-1 receptor-associated kinase 1-like isoform X2 [Sinocyclocheilus anshuiensis]|uniref:interleukin-1 receptor-associated kinase 1-like isoform X2 n=1 Tax=Sinocyclocheilus anshuiensis TaxID=1608454 RepID=UPI0007B8BF82|nr:PREDICTED: interleukin-1 receptor-associated kinase 1-like isoform X2 [Sinocyclocheilus anshuiensis]
MSGAEFEREFLYNLPASVMNQFTRIMDSLSRSDWILFASQVISDQTELHLLEQSPRRTDNLIHKWGCRNGTVGELLKILEGLQWFRARDIILECRHIRQFRSEQQSPLTVPPVPACQSSTATFVKESLPVPEVRLLPKPSPPPPDLDSMDSRISNIESPCANRVDPLPLSSTAMSWPLEEIQSSTCNFSPCKQIGEGGFGHVYKAVMRNTEFAVKKLKEDSHLDWNVVKESFRTEVEKLSQYRHPNIMDFVGYSIEGQTYCLIYVYMPKGSLEDRLRCEDSNALSWSQRVNVLLGTAKAIQYLHSSSPALIHGDIKSSNILLGDHLEPKLGDFGLARFCRNPNKTPGKTSTVAQTATVRGTLAYLPEEYLKDGQLGVEIDIYSFGVVMLEVLTGRQALEVNGQSRTVYLKDLVNEEEDDGRSFSKGKHSRELSYTYAAENICRKHLDPRLMTEDTPSPHGSMEISQLACQCLDRRRKKRPRMTEVFKALQDVHLGLKTSCRSTTVRLSPVSSHPSTPEPLRSDSSSLDSLTHQFSKLRPQEDTYPCLHKTVCPTLTSVVTQSSCSESELNAESWASQSSGMPCESDESQGFSQYLTGHCSRAQVTSCGACGIQSTKTSGSLVENSSQSSPNEDFSDKKVFVNPVRQRLVQKMELYEEGRILTSDLLSSGASLYYSTSLLRRHSKTRQMQSQHVQSAKTSSNR